MSWLGQNGASRDDFYALADAYKKVYGKEQLDEKKDLPDFIQKKIDEKKGKKDDDKKDDKKPAFLKKEEFEAWVDAVLEEGADLSQFTTEEVYDFWASEVLQEESDEEGEEFIIEDEYDVSYADGCMIEEGKKSCKSGYKWDSKKGKCVKKKKSSSSKSSKKTVVVVKGGGGYRMPWMGGGHSHGNDNDNDTDKGDNGGGDGGDAGGGDGGGGE
jgi:CRISPR/Cas system CSM-associated protein Csm4 (group 5 of RAMP superfamily)